jgi:PAS domain S-box-containing protein/putative nucleotidyltransferase with HDIG domain
MFSLFFCVRFCNFFQHDPLFFMLNFELQKPYDVKRVMIIDDDHDFAESLFDILELHNYQAQILNDPLIIAQSIESFKPHICLIDIRLGNENGIDLLPLIKKLSPSTLCVMITAYAHIETAVNALQNGAYDYLRKPISGEELVSALNRCFEKLNLEYEKKQAEDILKIRNQELKDANARLRDIVESNKKIATCAEINEFGTCSLKEIAHNLSALGGSFFVKKDNSFILLHSLDNSHTPRTLPLPLKNGSVFQQILETKKPCIVNNIDSNPNIKKSGWTGYKDSSLISFPILDSAGEVIGLISLHNKISPPFTKQDLDYGLLIASYTSESLATLKATEDVLKGEEKYRCLVETMSDGLIVLSDAFYVTYANDRFCNIVGYTYEELRQKPITEFMSTKSKVEFCKLFRERDIKVTSLYEVDWIQKNNSIRTSLVSPQSFPSLSIENNDMYCFAVVTDITERKISEEALQKQKYESDIRVKELDCLFAISSLVDKTNFSIDDVLNKTVMLIPQAFQYPNSACARIKLYNKEYCTKNCASIKGCLFSIQHPSADRYLTHSLSVANNDQGSITVWYREIMPQSEIGPFLKEEARLVNAAAELIGSIIERKQSQDDLKNSLETLKTAMEGIIQAMAMTTEMRDPYTAGHQRRVAKLASAIAEELGLNAEEIDGIRLAGIIHDLGKIYVPAEILSKPGHISDIEMSIIRTHPQVGHDILKSIAFPWPIAQMVQQHHERLDGSGYPLGLKGDDILLGARILSVADTVEAMASHRPYRPSLGIDVALEEINRNRGKFYESKIVETCIDLFEKKNFEF